MGIIHQAGNKQVNPVNKKTNPAWPDHIRQLAGTWPDFPDTHKLRRHLGTDTKNETDSVTRHKPQTPYKKTKQTQ